MFLEGSYKVDHSLFSPYTLFSPALGECLGTVVCNAAPQQSSLLHVFSSELSPANKSQIIGFIKIYMHSETVIRQKKHDAKKRNVMFFCLITVCCVLMFFGLIIVFEFIANKIMDSLKIYQKR